MKCPFCGNSEDKVLDSRVSKDGSEIRRRRECLKCHRRFSTKECIELNLPAIVKKDGKREPFNSEKIRAGLKKAFEKRPISMDRINEIVSKIEQMAIEQGENEIPASFIGEKLVQEIRTTDHVAYVRFASVYKDFKDPSQFMEELQNLITSSKK